MAKQSYTLSDKVLYDDASLYIAKEGEKLYFNFKKNPMVETYNVLEAVAIMINHDKFQDLPIWDIALSDVDREVNSIAPVFYWLCHTNDVEDVLKLYWSNYCEKIIDVNKAGLCHALQVSEKLGDVRRGVIRETNFDKVYSQLLNFLV